MAKGVDIDSYDTNGLTPLMWAVIRGAGPETIRVLLALGPVFIIITYHHCLNVLHTISIRPMIITGSKAPIPT